MIEKDDLLNALSLPDDIRLREELRHTYIDATDLYSEEYLAKCKLYVAPPLIASIKLWHD